MKKGDLVVDADGNCGVVVCLLITAPEGAKECLVGTVGFVYFFSTQTEEVMYEEEIQTIGEYNGTYFLEG